MTESNVQATDRADRDDSSQDPAQPVVGAAIQFQKMIVPDDEPVVEDNKYGEVIDENRTTP
jgi:hypothetical protein